MPNILRHLVSGAKARHVDNETGVDLDLVYLTPRLILMAWPGTGIEGLYRNKRSQVRRFLEAKHDDRFRIFNLVPVQENSYSASEFDDRVSRYPFPDHHPPPLSMIPACVADITAHLGQHPKNIAVVHCKAGKGRSGTMAVAYLLSLPILPTLDGANQSVIDAAKASIDEPVARVFERAKSLEVSRALPTPGIIAAGIGAAQTAPEFLRRGSVPNAAVSDVRRGSAGGKFLAVPGSEAVEEEEEMDSFDSPQEQSKEEQVAERLRTVFELHTAKRLKPAPSSPSKANASLPRKALVETLNQVDAAGARGNVEVLEQADESITQQMESPSSARTSSRSRAGSLFRRPSFNFSRLKNRSEGASPADGEPERTAREGTPGSATSPGTSSSPCTSPLRSRATSRSRVDLRALGSSPGGKSMECLSLGAAFSMSPSSSGTLPPRASHTIDTELRRPAAADVTAPALEPAQRTQLHLDTAMNGNKVKLNGNGTAHRKEGTSPVEIPPRTSSAFCRSSDDEGAFTSASAPRTNGFFSPSGGEESDEEHEAEAHADAQEPPPLAISIPSQRRFLGYWARLLAGGDPRASIYAPSGTRTVRILHVWIDRYVSADVAPSESSVASPAGESNGTKTRGVDNLSVQLVRYDPALIARLEKFEKGARRRKAAFRHLDPSAAAPSLPWHSEEDEKAAQAGAESARRRLESRWKVCEEVNAKRSSLAQHGNKQGVGEWGFNIVGEAQRARDFWWGDEAGAAREPITTPTNNGNGIAMSGTESPGGTNKSKRKDPNAQLDYFALVPEKNRERVGTSSSAKAIVRYHFDPAVVADASASGGPGLASRSSINLRSPTFAPVLGKRRKSHAALADLPNAASPNGSSAGSALRNGAGVGRCSMSALRPGREGLSMTPATASAWNPASSPDTDGRRSTRSVSPHAPGSPASSDDRVPAAGGAHGIIVDADRELAIKVLLGRTGAMHAKLPDIASAGWAWFIPAFEEPHAKPRPGQRTRVRMGPNEIDFRKSGALAVGGEVRAIGVEFEWVTTGDDEEEEEEEEIAHT